VPDRIVAVDVIVCSPSRNFVTVKITTADGVVGYGDATLNGRELAVATYLMDHVGPLLIDRDPARIEDTWQYLYRGVYWRRGSVTMAAIGAVDVALWDIKGKTLGQPVYQLLGGAVRDRVLSYTHATGWDVPPRYRYCQVSSMRAGSRSMSNGPTWSIRYVATASSRPLRVASP
jgi:mannonate dehydratase